MREKAMPAPTAPSPPLSPPVQPLQSVQASPPAQTIEPAKPAQSSINGQITQPLRPLQQVKPTQPPSSDSSSAAKSVVPRKTSSLPQPQAGTRTAKKNYAAPKAGEVKNNIAKPFSIQIIAYPEKDKADALAKQIRAGKIPARVEDVAIKGKGRWHRVLVGKFKNRTEALEYFSDHKIGKLYPQSFIQKSPNI
jgi:cell division septation protein DedD